MSDLRFQPAQKQQRKARVFLSGPAGSGKTWTVLSWAKVLGESVALIDTEHSSSLAYADEFTFSHLDLHPPFTVDRYIGALTAAADAGFEVLVIDSLSHAWAGKGGLLELVDEVGKANRGDRFGAGWREATPKHLELIEALLSYPGHLIGTARSKTDYAIENDGQRNRVVKLGMAPVQRDGLDYEFDVVGEMSVPDNALTITKTRCAQLAGFQQVKPDAKVAEVLRDWLGTGKEVKGEARPTVSEVMVAVDEATDAAVILDWYEKAKRFHLLPSQVVDEKTGQESTLQEFIASRGRAAKQATEGVA